MEKLLESLSLNERKIIPYLLEKIDDICEKSGLDKTSVLRALEYLQNKGILKLTTTKENSIEFGMNGAIYQRKGLPERRLLNVVNEKKKVSLQEAEKLSELSNDEFKASLGALKKKALIELENGELILNANPGEVSKKTLEELFLDKLPLAEDKLTPEQKFALQSLQRRKDIVQIIEKKETSIELTEEGKKLMNQDLSKHEDMIEVITQDLLKSEKNWKGKKFRRYDLTSPTPQITGGKRHFVNQSTDYARKVWTEMGFQEMTGDYIQSSFWNFDALFTAQDHPVREMQDTFFLKNLKATLPDKKIVERVKNCHEKGVAGSKGWGGKWNEENAKRMVLRTHTTAISSNTLANLKKEDLPIKLFAVGKCFRNETVDWSHGFEFNQTEGIVIDPNANFRHLLGYLRQFAKKMGFEKVRFRPSYFPYTEPSVEGDVWNEERQQWVEVFAAGMFRPEVTEPLLGTPTPVLAWGPGFDRMIMNLYGLKDLRELYKNDINLLRNIKFWTKQ